MNRLTLDDMYPAMPWDALDAVVFDVGNVLVRFVPEDILRRVLPGEEAIWPELQRKVFRSPYWAMLDRGVMTYEEAAKAMTGREGHRAVCPCAPANAVHRRHPSECRGCA